MNVVYIDFVAEQRRRRLPAPVSTVLDWLVCWFYRLMQYGARLFQVIVNGL